MDRLALSVHEYDAAAAVASMASGKREQIDEEMRDPSTTNAKKARTEIEQSQTVTPVKQAPVIRVLRPAPFFFYKDFSEVLDDDPLTPLTAPGRVPNFPAKMHAILCNSDLKGVVAWLPHGRSWRVLKPREFEVKVLPMFFEHSKYSSFVRQANGWGFRRITQGPDRNSYYHEKFLRGLPHLSKTMKRPGVAEKKTANPEHEPDFYEISKLHPLPETMARDEAVLLDCTMEGGPRARVPIYSSAVGTTSLLTAAPAPKRKEDATALPPRDHFAMNHFQHSLQTTGGQLGMNFSRVAPTATHPHPLPAYLNGPARVGFMPVGAGATLPNQTQTLSALAAANRLSLQVSPASGSSAASSTCAASQFAAGFAAATALSQHQFRNILEDLAQQQKQQNNSNNN